MIVENSKKWFIEVIEEKGKWEIWWTVEKTTGLERYSIHEKDTDDFLVFRNFRESQKWLKKKNKEEAYRNHQREIGLRRHRFTGMLN